MKIEGVVTTEEFVMGDRATEPSKRKCRGGIPIMNLKKLVWTIVHWFQLEKSESDPQHLKI